MTDLDIFRALTARDNFMILTHRGPDGDTLGSAFALKRLLENLGRKAFVACSDPIPQRLTFITDRIAELEMAFEPETVVCVDVADSKMLGEKYGTFASRVDFCIDHHHSNPGYAAQTILNGEKSSTGELLFDLITKCGYKIDAYMAEKLYTAISSDTGCFKFSNTMPSTHLAAAALLSFGFDSAEINRRLFDIATLPRLRLEGLAAQNIQLYAGGRISLLCITQQMLSDLDLEDEDLDGLTSITRRVQGIEVSITMRQMSNGKLRVSLRSETDRTDVSAIAAKFGGGGHVRAAGCSFTGDPEAAKKEIITAVEESIK